MTTEAKKRIDLLIERHGGRCFWCGCKCEYAPDLSHRDTAPTKDHLHRKADGGASTMNNLVLACRKCNNERHSKRGWKPKREAALHEALAIYSGDFTKGWPDGDTQQTTET